MGNIHELYYNSSIKRSLVPTIMLAKYKSCTLFSIIQYSVSLSFSNMLDVHEPWLDLLFTIVIGCLPILRNSFVMGKL